MTRSFVALQSAVKALKSDTDDIQVSTESRHEQIFHLPLYCIAHVTSDKRENVILLPLKLNYISIYQLDDVGISSNLVGSLSNPLSTSREVDNETMAGRRKVPFCRSGQERHLANTRYYNS